MSGLTYINQWHLNIGVAVYQGGRGPIWAYQRHATSQEHSTVKRKRNNYGGQDLTCQVRWGGRGAWPT